MWDMGYGEMGGMRDQPEASAAAAAANPTATGGPVEVVPDDAGGEREQRSAVGPGGVTDERQTTNEGRCDRCAIRGGV